MWTNLWKKGFLEELGLLENLRFENFPLGRGGVFGLGLLEKLRIGHFPLGGGGVLGLGPLKKDLSTYFWEGGGQSTKNFQETRLRNRGVHQPRIPQTNLEADLWRAGSCDGEIPRKS